MTFICSLSSGFYATVLDEEYVYTFFFFFFFWPHLRGDFFLAVFGIWRSNFSHGLSLLQYLYVSRLSGLPYSCRNGWRILMNFHSEAHCSVVRILLSSPH